MIKLNDVTRLEIIDESGRAFARYDLGGVAIFGQDDGETLKVFIDGGEDASSTITVLQAVLYLLSREEDMRADATRAIEYHLKELFEEDGDGE